MLPRVARAHVRSSHKWFVHTALINGVSFSHYGRFQLELSRKPEVITAFCVIACVYAARTKQDDCRGNVLL